MSENENVMTREAVDCEEVSAADAAGATVNEPVTEPVPTPEEVNARNAAVTTGNIGDDGQGAAFFTAADVRAMSRAQVRANLDKILKSMESAEF